MAKIKIKGSEKRFNLEKIVVFLLIVTLALTLYNAFQVSSLGWKYNAFGIIAASVNPAKQSQSAVQVQQPAIDSEVIPKGVPEIYGKELGISFNDVSASNPQKADATIKTLGEIDLSVTLEGADLKRYINILYVFENGMSCEYCCGARAIIFEDGEPACGCAHSYAMRGLTKYLITKHGSEYTDEEILEEVGKWKTLFFPAQMSSKAKVLKEKGIEFNYINLASNKYRGIEAQTAGGSGMVGGC